MYRLEERALGNEPLSSTMNKRTQKFNPRAVYTF
jgi:hypothetical protein